MPFITNSNIFFPDLWVVEGKNKKKGEKKAMNDLDPAVLQSSISSWLITFHWMGIKKTPQVAMRKWDKRNEGSMGSSSFSFHSWLQIFSILPILPVFYPACLLFLVFLAFSLTLAELIRGSWCKGSFASFSSSALARCGR